MNLRHHANHKPLYRRPILWLALVLVLISSSSVLLRDKAHSVKVIKNLRVVEIDLKKGMEIRPVLAKGDHRRAASFSEMMTRLHPYAAINGTFFDDNLQPLGDVLIDGKLVVRGGYPNAIAMRKDGKVEFVRRKGKVFDWSDYRFALAGGPRLVHKGKISFNPTADGFKTIAKDISAPRSGVGLTKSGKLLLVVCTEPVKLREFADAMIELGAVEAMNLDGGPACGLYCDGKTIVNARLWMTNVLAIYKR